MSNIPSIKYRYLPYTWAKRYMQTDHPNVRSRSQYIAWHKENNIKFLPNRPHRVYDQWEGWGMFLKTNNSFERTRTKIIERNKLSRDNLPFWEAVRYAQQMAVEHDITSMHQWREWCDSGKCKKHIPKYPEYHYPEFVQHGWRVWLGKDIKGKLDAAAGIQGCVAIARMVGAPDNVLAIVVDREGLASMKSGWRVEVYRTPVRVYKWQPDDHSTIEEIFSYCGSKQGDGTYIVTNINDLLFELDDFLIQMR